MAPGELQSPTSPSSDQQYKQQPPSGLPQQHTAGLSQVRQLHTFSSLGIKGVLGFFRLQEGKAHLEMKRWQGAGAGAGGRRKAEAQAGSTTMKENPLGGTVPAALLAGTPAVPSTGRSAGGQRSTARQEVAFRGEADCD